MTGDLPLKVYWQPGCTSCLHAKEFLTANGVAFQSINARADPAAAAQLERFGVRTVPVIARGDDYVLAQDIDELARFVGIESRREPLAADELVHRLQVLLGAAGTLLSALPEERLHSTLPQRERTWLDLGFHVSMIVQGLIAAATGGELTYEMYERRAPESWRDAGPAIDFGRATQRALDTWWQGLRHSPDTRVRTYFGETRLASLLERSAWHVAQHCRQLDYLVHEVAGVRDAPRLPPNVLEGLPVPEAIWDAEIVPT